MRSAVSTSQAPLASRRMRTPGPHADADGGDPIDRFVVADLDLDGAASGAQCKCGGNVGRDPRDHRVDRDAIAHRRWKRQRRRLERRAFRRARVGFVPARAAASTRPTRRDLRADTRCAASRPSPDGRSVDAEGQPPHDASSAPASTTPNTSWSRVIPMSAGTSARPSATRMTRKRRDRERDGDQRQRDQPRQRAHQRADRRQEQRDHDDGDQQRAACAAHRGAPRGSACPTAVSVGMSRRLLTISSAHASSPTGTASQSTLASSRSCCTNAVPHGRDEPEEDEHRDLAEPARRIWLRAAGVQRQREHRQRHRRR